MKASGGCLCGAVRYENDGDPIFAGHCHCTDCQKATGTGHVSVTGLPHWPDYLAGQASAAALSPDGRTLLILTSGFNRLLGSDGKLDPDAGDEYVFVFDVTGPKPVQRQVLHIPNVAPGEYRMWCDMPGHAAAGQTGSLLVKAVTESRSASA